MAAPTTPRVGAADAIHRSQPEVVSHEFDVLIAPPALELSCVKESRGPNASLNVPIADAQPTPGSQEITPYAICSIAELADRHVPAAPSTMAFLPLKKLYGQELFRQLDGMIMPTLANRNWALAT